MNALNWTRAHLLHRSVHAAEARPRPAHELRMQVVAEVLGAYLALTILLVVAAAMLGMTSAQAWGFGLGVATYMLAFGSFIGGLVFVVGNNIVDDPSRR